ncbi:TonB-dependent receptor [Cognatilysobacter segetis]|uniref:TonB-dependent receptor n=1 Tax=Cognatilysobacter segetis TaxID=2492394 RepID=UPI001EE476B4|nr:TonB-dependent receptor [Lysobacter segetis]
MTARRSSAPPSLALLAIALATALPAAAAPATAPAPAPAPAPADENPQDAHHDQPRQLDRVVVTAAPRRATAEELVRPVDVLGGERLDEARGSTLGETVTKLPGVQSSNFGPGVGRPIIRGLEGGRVGVLSGGLSSQDVSTVSQDHAVAIEPFLADQIEVLKGPATLLYGSGAIGGVVNVVDGRIAEKPLDSTLTGRAELRHDTVNDGFTGMARVDASGADGTLVLHADAVYRDQGDYSIPGGGRQANSFIDTKSAALGVSRVGALGFAGVAASRFEDAYGNPGEPGDPAAGERGVSLRMKQDRVEAKAGLDRDFGIFDGLRASLGGTDYEHVEYEGEQVGTRFLNKASEGRIELTHRALAGWTGAVGLQGVERRFEAIGEEAFVPRTRTRGWGVFVTEQRRWGPLQIDVGARVDRIETAPAGGGTRAFRPVSLSAGAAWKFSDAWRLNLNLDRAERAPGEEELFADGPHVATLSYEVGDAQLRKERANGAELGLHYHGGRVDAKLSAYQTRFDGFIYLGDTGEVADIDGEPLPVRQWSQADARFRGVEGEIVGHLLDADAGRLDARLFGDRVRATLDDGGNLPRIAPARVGAELRWRGADLRASLGATHWYRQDDVAAGESATAGYTLVDAHAAYHIDRGATALEFFADATNLTDQVARVHTSFLKDRVVLPGRGVAFGVRVFF